MLKQLIGIGVIVGAVLYAHHEKQKDKEQLEAFKKQVEGEAELVETEIVDDGSGEDVW